MELIKIDEEITITTKELAEIYRQRANQIEENERLKAQRILDKYYTVTKVQKQFKKNFKWQELKSSSIALGYEIKKVPCPKDGEANAYHSDVWGHVYGVDL